MSGLESSHILVGVHLMSVCVPELLVILPWMNLTRSDKRKELVTAELMKEMVKVNVLKEKKRGTCPSPVKQTEMSMGSRENADQRAVWQIHSRL